MRIALLCNNKMAFPAMQRMISEGVLCGVATADNDPEVVEMVKQLTVRENIHFQVISHKGRCEQLKEWLVDVSPDIVFVMTFPWRLTVDILQIPPRGFLNFHYGLLPQMRGADPIFESIRQQKKTAGLTVHLMDEGFDTGPIVTRVDVPIFPESTYGMLCGQMARIGEDVCRQLIQDLMSDCLTTYQPQDESSAIYWPKIGKEHIRVRWRDMTQAEIIALIRSCNPIARGVPVLLNGWEFGVYDATAIDLQGDTTTIMPGTIITIDPQNGLIVCSADGKGVRLDVIITGEGVFPGSKLVMWGIAPGNIFS